MVKVDTIPGSGCRLSQTKRPMSVSASSTNLARMSYSPEIECTSRVWLISSAMAWATLYAAPISQRIITNTDRISPSWHEDRRVGPPGRTQ